MIAIDRVTEFTKHHCSGDLKRFLDVTAWITGGAGERRVPEGGIEEMDDSTSSSTGAGDPLAGSGGSQNGKVSA